MDEDPPLLRPIWTIWGLFNEMRTYSSLFWHKKGLLRSSMGTSMRTQTEALMKLAFITAWNVFYRNSLKVNSSENLVTTYNHAAEMDLNTCINEPWTFELLCPVQQSTTLHCSFFSRVQHFTIPVQQSTTLHCFCSAEYDTTLFLFSRKQNVLLTIMKTPSLLSVSYLMFS